MNEIQPLNIAPEHNIDCQPMLYTLKGEFEKTVLLMRFSGTYGYGCKGNTDARYMTAMTHASIAFADPDALVFDFSKLTYEWGDAMAGVIAAGCERELETLVIAGEMAQEGLISLVDSEMMMEPSEVVFISLESANERLKHLLGAC
ncbi:hypothetical protein HCH_03824 [Hahella chejuensis KCTC 2396]|uniref:Uncharacterized protein n=1 Tax=Hahella chejuensis (strain KCTC 2396) TaxID=349521 RepID=Q2SFL9_HAHCH|nr:hypothetical protein [Hahella chejuensis]ABC30555.1 hypothetical protein HCH_03824 [Hahella chejuensis KCTC 2396]